ncbi:MAG TPA: c-type cytochrome domain-containing protein, partial [Solirubrobacterales bacterium]|nr:c-type cytochrome domain-containing protein [Solirubrobacterales bacterium]
MRARLLRSLGLGLALAAPCARAADSAAQKAFAQFAGKYCLKCHDTKTQKGDREFDTFKLPLASEEALITAKDIIDQLTLGEMPPAKEKAQPTDAERLAVIRA